MRYGRIVQRALAAGLAPMLLLALAIGAFFARRSSRRLTTIHDTIARIMKGDMDLRLPVGSRRDPIDKISRDVNLMLDEIVRLLVQIKGVGDNIAHDLRSPLAVVHAQLERGLESSDDEQLRAVVKQALAHIDKAMLTVAALLRLADVEYGPKSSKFQPIDLSAICADLFEFYEPLATSKSIKMALEIQSPVQILGDGDLMREAVSNLIGNAIKFTPENGTVRHIGDARRRPAGGAGARQRHRRRAGGARQDIPALLPDLERPSRSRQRSGLEHRRRHRQSARTSNCALATTIPARCSRWSAAGDRAAVMIGLGKNSVNQELAKLKTDFFGGKYPANSPVFQTQCGNNASISIRQRFPGY